MTWVSTPACGLSSPSGPWAITMSSAGISLGQLRPCFPGESERSQQVLISFLQLRVCGKRLLRCCSCGSADKTLKRLGKRQRKVCYQKRGCRTGAFWLQYSPDRWVKTATCTGYSHLLAPAWAVPITAYSWKKKLLSKEEQRIQQHSLSWHQGLTHSLVLCYTHGRAPQSQFIGDTREHYCSLLSLSPALTGSPCQCPAQPGCAAEKVVFTPFVSVCPFHVAWAAFYTRVHHR